MTVEAQQQVDGQNGAPADDTSKDIQPNQQDSGTDIRNKDGSADNTGDDKTAPKQDANKSEPVDKKTLGQVDKFLQDAGLDSKSIAKEFTENDGNLSIESMKALVDKHGEAVAGLIVDKLKGLHQHSVKLAEERDNAIFKQVEEAFEGVTEQGGKETWTELATWAKTNVPTEDRTEINSMLGRGGLSAKLAVDYLVNKFKTSDDYQQPAQLLEAESTGSNKSNGAIDRQTYVTELNALLAKGHNYETSPEIRALEARRQKGIARGI